VSLVRKGGISWFTPGFLKSSGWHEAEQTRA
jgi:hypothetical protein